MSFGIVAVKLKDDVPHYLLIQRRDSMAYVEFLRGKYKLEDAAYIKMLLNGMTPEERTRLLNTPFETLWTNLWNSQNTRQYRNEYEMARKQFDTLRNTGDTYGRILASFVYEAESKWPTPEWGFPKGRRNTSESIKTTALREFTEETGVPKQAVTILQGLDPYVEQYIGTNGITYKQTYFLGLCKPDVVARFEENNRIMTREIGDLAWLPFEDALERIRPTNKEKRAMLTQLHKDVTTKHRERLASSIEWTTVGTSREFDLTM